MKHKPKFWVTDLHQTHGLQMLSCSVGYFTSITKRNNFLLLFLRSLLLSLPLSPLCLLLFLQPVDCMLLFLLNSQSLFCKCFPEPTEVITWCLFFLFFFCQCNVLCCPLLGVKQALCSQGTMHLVKTGNLLTTLLESARISLVFGSENFHLNL